MLSLLLFMFLFLLLLFMHLLVVVVISSWQATIQIVVLTTIYYRDYVVYNLCSHLPGIWELEVQVSQTRGVQRQGNCGACRYAGNASTACDWWGVGGRVVHCHQLLQVVAHLKDRNNGC